MSATADVIYHYDGSFDGFLCCVFASYTWKEIPLAICPPENGQQSLLDSREILTEADKAERVLWSIPEKIGGEALDFLRRVFCTCLENKERDMLLFLRMGYHLGPKVLDCLKDPLLHRMIRAVRHLENESHLLKGFLRFSEVQNVLVAKIGPKNYVLPLLSEHFQERYPEEHFLIYDETHKMALVYRPHKASFAYMDRLDLPPADADELHCRELWQVFYDAVEITARHNPKCRRTMMPKRYWPYMTEFQRALREGEAPAAKHPEVAGEILSAQGS